MKRLYVFAGVNGAGKSTFYVNQLETNAYYGARINSDELVREFGDWQNSSDQNRAARLALKLRKSYLQRGIDFNIETTLSGKSVVNFIKDAKNLGYFIVLFYVGLESVQLSKQRVAIRVAKNGHDIDESVLERRYRQSFENLHAVLPLCDEAFLYDNSKILSDEKEQKFSNLELIAKKDEGQMRILVDRKIWWLKGDE